MGAAGNEAFKAKEYKKAIGHYMQAGSPPLPALSPSRQPLSCRGRVASVEHWGRRERRDGAMGALQRQWARAERQWTRAGLHQPAIHVRLCA